MIQPGLERIGQLLKNVQFPWKSIHVAGTNGKGSVCMAASHFLTRRTIRNGRFTSPHLVDRWDCIEINGKPVFEQEFRKVEDHFIQLNERDSIGASEFELLTATAFQLFNDKKVEVGVIEVGMGGKLDATNILNNQVVSVISKIAREHQNFLGTSLEEIAQHKAGILRPNVPYLVNPMNEWNVKHVIDDYAKEIGAAPRILLDTPELHHTLFKTKDWLRCIANMLPFQRDNIVLAYLAFLEALKSLHASTRKAPQLVFSLRHKAFPGRLQELTCPPVFTTPRRTVMVDGAHNPDSAARLAEWVRKHGRKRWESTYPITWVLAMTEGKDVRRFLRNILEPGDNVVTTTFGPVDGMPWVKPMDPQELSRIAKEAEPGVTSIHVPVSGTFRALCAAKYLAGHRAPIVLTGSLYLVGDFMRLRRQYDEDPECLPMRSIDSEEKRRVNMALSRKESGMIDEATESNDVNLETEKRRLEEEIESLDREMQSLQVEETRLRRAQFMVSDNDRDSILAKEKLYGDFEGIRPQQEQPLSPGSVNSPIDNDLRHLVEAKDQSYIESVLRDAEIPRGIGCGL
ncbi:FolC bifunctional protein [Massarina eburnea CBS 473.64]|uniref:FolC bifunctional protein n=1 Tax=Massarina eburnea CBS 473.64 TaxID=1395130 RepID=A0A6A6RL18_9PLEO|nr:FolC bifunctional protein [Massarina eburnea CBS 473.64]